MHSQHGEDELILPLFPEGFVGTAVEVGAGDGVLLSNTLAMERLGWRVLCVEPNPNLYAKLKNNRALSINAACSDYEKENDNLFVYPTNTGIHHGIMSVIKPPTPRFIAMFLHGPRAGELKTTRTVKLDTAIEEGELGSADFVSIDVDGVELSVLSGFDPDRWNNKVVMVESPFGDPQIKSWFDDHGYSMRHQGVGGINDIYVRSQS